VLFSSIPSAYNPESVTAGTAPRGTSPFVSIVWSAGVFITPSQTFIIMSLVGDRPSNTPQRVFGLAILCGGAPLPSLASIDF